MEEFSIGEFGIGHIDSIDVYSTSCMKVHFHLDCDVTLQYPFIAKGESLCALMFSMMMGKYHPREIWFDYFVGALNLGASNFSSKERVRLFHFLYGAPGYSRYERVGAKTKDDQVVYSSKQIFSNLFIKLKTQI